MNKERIEIIKRTLLESKSQINHLQKMLNIARDKPELDEMESTYTTIEAIELTLKMLEDEN